VTVVVGAAPAPVVPASWYAHGVRLFACATRYATPSALAGVKHGNRLEQVLARAEWNDAAYAEGLMCDAHGHAISATAANLFARIDGMLATPSVERCGVAGVARAEVLACRDTVVRDIGVDELARADEVFLTSSLRGIVPVAAIGQTRYAIGETTRELVAHWQERGWTT
ncbi:MAG TPA: aminotransferase class IV, partial [Tahibacter sp.]|nr:aminotransferase class IV [Tahibacter sp.]